MSIVNYLKLSGLLPDTPQALDELTSQVAFFQAQYQHACQSMPTPQVQWRYQVPELGEGGACSLFGQLSPEPYDLSVILGGETPANQRLLGQMISLCNFYQQHSQSEWFGIYQRRINAIGETVLVKLAYYGAPSRAEFPLTEAFAAISNNSSVGLSGQARIIHDVPAYLQQGGEYYTCDPKVLAEACIPLYNPQGQVVGIIDAEAFQKNLYQGSELALLIAVATLVPQCWA